MSNAPRTTQLYHHALRLSLAATRSSKKGSLLEGESGLTPARKTPPTRYKPARACLAACLTEAARGTEVMIGWRFLFGIVRKCNRGMRVALPDAIRGSSAEIRNNKAASLLRLRK